MSYYNIEIDIYSLGLKFKNKSRDMDYYYVYCPFHVSGDTKTNAIYDPKKDTYKCFSCGMYIPRQASKHLVVQTGGSVLYKKSEGNYIFKEHNNKNNISDFWYLPKAYDNPYLLSRKVDNSLVDIFDLRCDSTGVYAPVKSHQGNIVGYNKRLTTENANQSNKYIFKGDNRFLYNYDKLFALQNKDRLYVTEGMFGVFRLYSLGITNCVSILSCSNILKFPMIFNSFTELYLILDDDPAGRTAARKSFEMFPNAYIAFGEADEIDNIEQLTFKRLHEHE